MLLLVNDFGNFTARWEPRLSVLKLSFQGKIRPAVAVQFQNGHHNIFHQVESFHLI